MNSNSNAPVGREDFFVKACFGSEGPAGPAGKDGQTPTVSVGKVETLAAGQSAEVVNSGTDKAAVFDFKIPKGNDGQNTKLMAPHYDSYEQLAAQHPAGTCGEAYLVGELNFIYVWDLKTNSWVSVGKLGYLPETFTEFRSDILEQLAARYTKNETDGQISAHNVSGAAHADIRHALETLQLMKLVDVLPAQGESKYLYAVPQDERTTDGQLIVVLFIWAGTEFAAVGALTTSVDLSEYLKKTEAQNTYLPKTGGYITGSLSIAREKGLIDTLMPVSGSGSGYTRLRIYSYDGSWVGYLLHNSVGDASIVLLDDGHLNIEVSNNKEIRVGGKRILTVGDKGVSGGVASLGLDGKVPLSQLPDIGGGSIMPVVDLGTVTEAEFETNTNYTLSINGSASFTLAYPSVYTVTNKITLNLNVLANSVIDWGANANAALAEFTPGKYQIRLLWDNISSAWSAEVLKETAAAGDTVVLCHFDGNCSNEAGGAVINQLVDANGVTWEELTSGFGLAAKNAMSSAGALFQFDEHESLVLDGDFTIEFTVQNPRAGQNSEYTMDFTDKIVYETLSATSERHGIQCHGNAAIAFGGKFLKSSVADYSTTGKKNVAVVRSGDTLYYYENGSLVMSGTGWQGITLDLRGWYMVGMTAGDKNGMIIDELRISRSAKYLTNYTPATSPFVLADSGVSDLHDASLSALAIKAVTPNYAAGQMVENVTSGTWTNVAKTSMVICYATDSYMENYEVKVSPNNGTMAYVVGKRYDDANEKTQGTSFSFIVSAGWSFTSTNEGTYTAYIYPLGV